MGVPNVDGGLCPFGQPWVPVGSGAAMDRNDIPPTDVPAIPEPPAVDPTWIARAAVGDPRALERVLPFFRDNLLAFVTRLMPPGLRPVLDPQDVVHDTCMEAFRRIGEFKAADPAAVQRWLFTIARHRVIDLVRTHRRIKRGGGRLAVDLGDDAGVARLLGELAVYERTPSRSAMRHELRLALEQSIGRLAAPLRDAVRLRHMTGLSFKEVAVKMDRTERAVQQLCTRALRELREELRSASVYM